MSVAVVALAGLACIALGAWWLVDPGGWLRRLSRSPCLLVTSGRIREGSAPRSGCEQETAQGPEAGCAPSGFKLVLIRLCGALLIAAGGAVLALLFMPVPP